MYDKVIGSGEKLLSVHPRQCTMLGCTISLKF